MLTPEDVLIDGPDLGPQAAISDSSAAKLLGDTYTRMLDAQTASEVDQKD
jgi:hypothetical protein